MIIVLALLTVVLPANNSAIVAARVQHVVVVGNRHDVVLVDGLARVRVLQHVQLCQEVVLARVRPAVHEAVPAHGDHALLVLIRLDVAEPRDLLLRERDLGLVLQVRDVLLVTRVEAASEALAVREVPDLDLAVRGGRDQLPVGGVEGGRGDLGGAVRVPEATEDAAGLDVPHAHERAVVAGDHVVELRVVQSHRDGELVRRFDVFLSAEVPHVELARAEQDGIRDLVKEDCPKMFFRAIYQLIKDRLNTSISSDIPDSHTIIHTKRDQMILRIIQCQTQNRCIMPIQFRICSKGERIPHNNMPLLSTTRNEPMCRIHKCIDSLRM
jgi:hypothetical protein